jgi:hypothetical protein
MVESEASLATGREITKRSGVSFYSKSIFWKAPCRMKYNSCEYRRRSGN